MTFTEFLLEYWYLTAACVITGFLFFRNLFDFSADGNISILEATQLMNRQNAVVIDVREPAEFATGHITHAINIPLGEIEKKKEALAKYKKKPIIVVCETGIRSGKARLKLIGMLENNEVYNLKGGMKEWQKENLPLKK